MATSIAPKMNAFAIRTSITLGDAVADQRLQIRRDVVEVALSCGLLVGAGLMIRSVMNLRTLDLGILTESVFTAQVGPARDAARQGRRRRQPHELHRTRRHRRGPPASLPCTAAAIPPHTPLPLGPAPPRDLPDATAADPDGPAPRAHRDGHHRRRRPRPPEPALGRSRRSARRCGRGRLRAVAGYHARRALTQQAGLPDLPVALAEDMLAITAAPRAYKRNGTTELTDAEKTGRYAMPRAARAPGTRRSSRTSTSVAASDRSVTMRNRA